jgi:hypothetical protein
VVSTGKKLVDDYLVSSARASLREYKKTYYVAAEIDFDVVNKTSATHVPTLTGFFRGDAYHAIAVSLSLVDRALMKSQTSSGHTIDVINHPLPRQPNSVVKDKVI